MSLFFEILLNDTLPILIAAGVGFLAARWLKPDVPSITRLAINVLVPCLVFINITTTKVDLWQAGKVMLFAVIVMFIAGLLARLTGLALHLGRQAALGLVLIVVFGNTGNLGLPVINFAFGPEALAQGTFYFITSNILFYTVGIFLVNNHRVKPLDALKSVARMPVIYAFITAWAMRALQFSLPTFILRPIEMFNNAALPLMVLVLGMQLHAARPRLTWPATAGILLRLIIVPIVVFPLARLIGLTGATLQAGMLQAATPSGIVATLFAAEYDLDPQMAATVIFISTLLSPFTITAWILILR